MKRTAGGACLSAVFVDYDNIYLSLKRKSEEAARRFARDAHVWLREIESGRLITGTHDSFSDARRRIVMNRCYGNPVPRRNAHDNSTDMNSFPFVRHHFLRAGFEVVDCPPLTAQLKNSSDIRMVMDVRDYLTHETYFDEFIILSGDADFTPVLHRLRAHARRTVIYANDHTAAPYTAISDGEVRESDLIALILNGEVPADEDADGAGPPTPAAKIDAARRAIVSEIVADVRAAPAPMLLEALADRTVRVLGHEKTIATGWAGAGSFRELLRQCLPADLTLTDEPPYLVVDLKRHGQAIAAPKAREQARELAPAPPAAPRFAAPANTADTTTLVAANPAAAAPRQGALQPVSPSSGAAGTSASMQQSIARIQEACQAPALAPHEYRLLFELMAEEINENDLIGAQTLANITHRAHERGLEVRRDDVRFILEVVSESDPWFEQGASANLFAGRFRNFVVARCRGQGLNLSADELDLVDAWFAGGNMPQPQPQTSPAGRAAPSRPPAGSGPPPSAPPTGRAGTPPISLPTPTPAGPGAAASAAGGRWWTNEAAGGEANKDAAAPAGGGGEPAPADEFPRFVRNRLRG